jgi:hypothetical protein
MVQSRPVTVTVLPTTHQQGHNVLIGCADGGACEPLDLTLSDPGIIKMELKNRFWDFFSKLGTRSNRCAVYQ